VPTIVAAAVRRRQGPRSHLGSRDGTGPSADGRAGRHCGGRRPTIQVAACAARGGSRRILRAPYGASRLPDGPWVLPTTWARRPGVTGETRLEAAVADGKDHAWRAAAAFAALALAVVFDAGERLARADRAAIAALSAWRNPRDIVAARAVSAIAEGHSLASRHTTVAALTAGACLAVAGAEGWLAEACGPVPCLGWRRRQSRVPRRALAERSPGRLAVRGGLAGSCRAGSAGDLRWPAGPAGQWGGPGASGRLSQDGAEDGRDGFQPGG
jgi:hypothetical protein